MVLVRPDRRVLCDKGKRDRVPARSSKRSTKRNGFFVFLSAIIQQCCHENTLLGITGDCRKFMSVGWNTLAKKLLRLPAERAEAARLEKHNLSEPGLVAYRPVARARRISPYDESQTTHATTYSGYVIDMLTCSVIPLQAASLRGAPAAAICDRLLQSRRNYRVSGES